MIVCNRGYEKLSNNISIFKIPEGGFNEEFLEKILPHGVLSSSELLEGTAEQVLEGIRDLGIRRNRVSF